MFKLNRLTDYAVVVLSRMAARHGEIQTAPQIAQETAIPLPTVSKVLHLLVHDGLVISQRGASGGYTLSRNPQEISVATIIQAVEGPIALTACVDGSNDHCGVESLCPMRGTWDKVNRAINSALGEVSLAEMVLPFDPAPQREKGVAGSRVL